VKHTIIALVLVLSPLALAEDPAPPDPIIRGDVNESGDVTVSDASALTNWLFSTGPEPRCYDAANANDDSYLDTSDAAYILNWLFSGGPAPPAPGPYECGTNYARVFDCEYFDPCGVDPLDFQ